MYVSNYAALRAWSAFPFENFNRVVKRLFHRTQSVLQQMCKLYLRLRYVKNNADLFQKADCSDKARYLFIKLTNQCKIKNCIPYSDDLRVFGQAKNKRLTISEKVNIENLLGEPVKDICQVYDRFIYKTILFYSTNYTRLDKRHNSCILTSDKIILNISNILKIECSTNLEIKWIILVKKFRIFDEYLCTNRVYNSRGFSFVTEETSSIVCCELTSIKSKCIIIPYEGNKYCIFPLVNTVETD